MLSAITYALMPIINKTALKENSSITTLIYGFLFGAIVMTPSAKPLEILAYVGDIKVLGGMIMLGVLLMVASKVIVLRRNNDEHNYIEGNSKVEIV